MWAMIVLALGTIPLALLVSPWWWLLEILFVPLALLGIYDYTQQRHSILRNFPILGHFRFLIEDIGPELHQYIVESNQDGKPFNRDTRSIIYERAKGVNDKKPFGTEMDVYKEGYTYLKHSIATRPMMEDAGEKMRITVGGPQCTQPYSLSILNISAMSFGALGSAAVTAMNKGAAKGNFAHDTGEGGLSTYHRDNGGDLIWQIGTGYFGCRTQDGKFDPESFRTTASLPQVKMIEIKVSQGAKPGHGGILPAEKVTQEIADARLVPVGETVYSPTYHQSFSTPLEMMDFITQLRELSGGKPVGFKICIGEPREFMGIVKAMKQTGVMPDFIVVDGGEGGTGAAPQEFSNSLGFPLAEGLALVHNTLVGTGMRPHIKIGASGKMVTAAAMGFAMALGADWCNSARAFMFSVGCIQSQRCHTNKCPVGVATQDPKLQRALNVPDKAERVYQFHKNTVEAFAEMIAAMGLDHPSELAPHHVERRVNGTQVASLDEIYPFIHPNQILEGHGPERIQRYWNESNAESFKYTSGLSSYRS
ncbi:MAG: FMN-binding glutamate synthase family protein [Acidimicrobiia bacterium]